jgi:hypothetical protein
MLKRGFGSRSSYIWRLIMRPFSPSVYPEIDSRIIIKKSESNLVLRSDAQLSAELGLLYEALW